MSVTSKNGSVASETASRLTGVLPPVGESKPSVPASSPEVKEESKPDASPLPPGTAEAQAAKQAAEEKRIKREAAAIELAKLLSSKPRTLSEAEADAKAMVERAKDKSFTFSATLPDGTKKGIKLSQDAADASSFGLITAAFLHCVAVTSGGNVGDKRNVKKKGKITPAEEADAARHMADMLAFGVIDTKKSK